jgi:hypothetical protein
LEADATRPVIDAVYSAFAAVLVGIMTVFELGERLSPTVPTPLSLSVVLGVLVTGLAVIVLSQHPLVSGFVALIAGIRTLTLLLRTSWLSIAALLGGVIIGYWMFLLSFVDGYKTPWVSDAILLGKVHVDLLFHSAIVNMFRSHGVGAMGVDGFLPFPYYFGSHRVVEVVSNALRLQPLAFYSIIFPLILCPVFLAGMFLLGIAFRRFIVCKDSLGARRLDKHGAWFWPIFAILFIGVMPVEHRRQLGIFDNAFHSESFGFGMLLALIPCILFFELLARREPKVVHLSWLAAGALYLGALCQVKLSVAFVIAGAAGYLLMRFRIPAVHRLMGAVAIALPLLLGLLSTRGSADAGTGASIVKMVKPFAYLRDVVAPGLRIQSFVAFFGPFFLFAALRIASTTSNRDWLVWKISAHKLIDVEILLFSLIVSITPGLILSIPQAGTNFFSEVSYWLVIPCSRW